jgi:hypothetical protein
MAGTVTIVCSAAKMQQGFVCSVGTFVFQMNAMISFCYTKHFAIK